MSDGTQSPLVGDQNILAYNDKNPDNFIVTTSEIPTSTKIAEVRVGLFGSTLVSFELLDGEGDLIGGERAFANELLPILEFKVTIPANETLIGFKVLSTGLRIKYMNNLALVTVENC